MGRRYGMLQSPTAVVEGGGGRRGQPHTTFSVQQKQLEEQTLQQRPATSRQRPATSRQRPATSRQRSATSRQRSATSQQRPATSRKRPATSRKRPATSQQGVKSAAVIFIPNILEGMYTRCTIRKSRLIRYLEWFRSS